MGRSHHQLVTSGYLHLRIPCPTFRVFAQSYDCNRAQLTALIGELVGARLGVFTEPREATGKCSTDPGRRKDAVSRTQDETRHTKIWTYILPASLVGQALLKLKGKVFVISYRLSFYHSYIADGVYGRNEDCTFRAC